MSSTVIVNTRQSARPADGPKRRKDCAAGAWPLRGDLEQRVSQAEWVVGVHRGRVLGAWPLAGHEVGEDGRVTFDLGDEVLGVAGRQAPAGWRWRRGESWPIKVIDADPLVALKQPFMLGPFAMQLAPDERTLTVLAPAGASVIVNTKAG